MARTKLTFGAPHVAIERRAGRVDDRALAAAAQAASPGVDRLARSLGDLCACARSFSPSAQAVGWRKVTYAEARDSARRIAQGLLDRGLDAERPVAILSGNSVDHALFGLGAMIAGVPYAPVSPPYSLVARDFAKLKAIIGVLTPGLVFVDDGGRSRRDRSGCAGMSRSWRASIRRPPGHRRR